MPDWLTIDEQRALIEQCQAWAAPPAPFRAIRVRNGVMSVKTVCLGWHWLPYRYTRIAEDVDGSPIAAMPPSLIALGKRAAAETFGLPLPETAPFEPDAALINFYDVRAHMGMHQDREEISDAPVVSLSLGNRALFRFGNTTNRARPYTDVELHSGDLFVFGGPSRRAFHGITKTFPGTADPALGLDDGRWNITLRQTGLSVG